MVHKEPKEGHGRMLAILLKPEECISEGDDNFTVSCISLVEDDPQHLISTGKT